MVTLSSAEAEYVALSQTAQETRWVAGLTTFVGDWNTGASPWTPRRSPLIIHCDNEAAKAVSELELDTKRSRHIDIRYHYVREKVQEGVLSIKWVRTKDMVADILTKPLDQQTIEHLWKLGGGV